MNEHDKIKVSVASISYSRLQQEIYLLVLAEEGGSMRIPIIVGAAEAQSIAIAMERLTPPRPMTHDLISHVCGSFDIQIVEVFIHRIEKGVFYTTMLMKRGDREVMIDARVSDAVAVALRENAPIYVANEVLSKAGYDAAQAFEKDTTDEDEGDLERMSDADLKARIEQAVAIENYEEAALIQQILQKRNYKQT